MHAMRWIWAMILVVVTILPARGADSILLATGVRGGNQYSVGGAICRFVNLYLPSGCVIVPTDGTLDNLYALGLGDVNFAILQADVQRAAQGGGGGIAGAYGDLRSVASVYPEMLTIVTRRDSTIARLADLGGRRVAAGSVNAGARWTLLSALHAIGLREADLATLLPHSDGIAATALCAGTIDAMVLMTGHPSATMSRIGQTCQVRVVGLSADEMGAVVGSNPAYRPISVPPGLYPFVPRPVPTIGTDATIATFASTPDAQVERILGAIFDDVEAFRRQQFVLAPVLWPDETRTAPLHPAARRFYRARIPVR